MFTIAASKTFANKTTCSIAAITFSNSENKLIILNEISKYALIHP
jgi:hypothetical protein